MNLSGNGRPSVLSESIMGVLDSENKKTRKISLRKMAKCIEKRVGYSINYTTVRVGLNKLGLKAYSPSRKPLLSKKHIQLRFAAAISWICIGQEAIKTIIFSDESKFNLFYSDGRVKVWREPGSCLQPGCFQPTVKHGGGSVMVWACFSYYGVGRLVFIDGTMDATKYVSILADNLRQSASNMGLLDFIFQQDNDPKHTSRLAEAFFGETGIKRLTWPSQSPDMRLRLGGGMWYIRVLLNPG
jgi:hypothetical protein